MRFNLMNETDEAGAGSVVADPAAAPVSPPAIAAAPAVSPPANAPAAKPDDKKPDDKAEVKEDKPGYWPEGWRESVSKDDAKMLKAMSRYATPEDVAKALIAAQDKIRSGSLIPVLGKDAKPEEVAEYRKAMGIPASADKYNLKDVKIEEAEKPFIGKLLEAAHGSNQTAEQVGATITTWNTIRSAALEAQVKSDGEAAKASEDTLRDEWGTDYRRHINLIHGLLDASGDQKLKDNLLSGRLADGTPIGSSPVALKLLLGVALKDNPAGLVLPNGNADPAKSVDQRIAEIEKMMRTDRKNYNKPEISGEDGEYQRLIKARETMKART